MRFRTMVTTAVSELQGVVAAESASWKVGLCSWPSSCCWIFQARRVVMTGFPSVDDDATMPLSEFWKKPMSVFVVVVVVDAIDIEGL